MLLNMHLFNDTSWQSQTEFDIIHRVINTCEHRAWLLTVPRDPCPPLRDTAPA